MDEDICGHYYPRAMIEYLNRIVDKELNDKDIQSSWGPFVKVIRVHEGLSLKDLSSILMVDKSLSTRTVRTLIEKGYVENRSESDRKYSLFLTEKGKDLSTRMESAFTKAWKDLFSNLEDDEILVLREVSRKIYNKIKGGDGQ
ncbi:MAG: MarR family transcriptional regulator [Candidatus Methanomethylophilaceae archaeon]|nr:MarR family transcriptional regulator [Candidatus Methanomethylophilaceae archaeon]